MRRKPLGLNDSQGRADACWPRMLGKAALMCTHSITQLLPLTLAMRSWEKGLVDWRQAACHCLPWNAICTSFLITFERGNYIAQRCWKGCFPGHGALAKTLHYNTMDSHLPSPNFQLPEGAWPSTCLSKEDCQNHHPCVNLPNVVSVLGGATPPAAHGSPARRACLMSSLVKGSLPTVGATDDAEDISACDVISGRHEQGCNGFAWDQVAYGYDSCASSNRLDAPPSNEGNISGHGNL